jgi:hypothetical protein
MRLNPSRNRTTIVNGTTLTNLAIRNSGGIPTKGLIVVDRSVDGGHADFTAATFTAATYTAVSGTPA